MAGPWYSLPSPLYVLWVTYYVSQELCMWDTNYVDEGHANLCRDPWMCEMSNPLVCVWVTNYVYETRTMWMSVMNICAMTLCVRWVTHCCVRKSRTMWGRAMILSVLTHVCVLRYPLYDSWSMYMSPELCMWFTNYVGEGQRVLSVVTHERVLSYPLCESRTMYTSHELCVWVTNYVDGNHDTLYFDPRMCFELPICVRESRTMCESHRIEEYVSHELCVWGPRFSIHICMWVTNYVYVHIHIYEFMRIGMHTCTSYKYQTSHTHPRTHAHKHTHAHLPHGVCGIADAVR